MPLKAKLHMSNLADKSKKFPSVAVMSHRLNQIDLTSQPNNQKIDRKSPATRYKLKITKKPAKIIDLTNFIPS